MRVMQYQWYLRAWQRCERRCRHPTPPACLQSRRASRGEAVPLLGKRPSAEALLQGHSQAQDRELLPCSLDLEKKKNRAVMEVCLEGQAIEELLRNWQCIPVCACPTVHHLSLEGLHVRGTPSAQSETAR